MNLKELLIKRGKNEDLSEEELNILKEYDESIQIYTSKIEQLEAEKTMAETKFSNADKEYQNALTQLSEKQSLIDKLENDKKDIQSVLDSTKSTQDAKMEMARIQAEKEKAEQLRKAEEERQQALAREQQERENLVNELKDVKSKYAKLQFTSEVQTKIATKPYIATQLKNLLAEIETEDLEKCVLKLSMLESIFNHEEEMQKYEASKKAGSSIFEKKEQQVVEQPNPVDSKSDLLDFARRKGFKIKR